MSQALQRWSAADYAENARFVADLGTPLLDLLAPKPGMRILDLGCGDGALTAKIAFAGAEVLGVDLSDDLLDAARARGLTVAKADGQALPFAAEFDAVFSNAALHWMLQPKKVVAGVARALKPGGRFVGEFGGHGNVAAIATAFRAVARRLAIDPQTAAPWFFPTPEDYRGLLEQGGFTVEDIRLIPRPTRLPGEMSAWISTFGGPFFALIPEAQREAAMAEIVALLKPALCDSEGAWTADYVRLRFSAALEA
jgi:SAM-dependent methyltransferase